MQQVERAEESLAATALRQLARGHGRHEIHGSGGANDSFVVLGSGLDALGRRIVGCRIEFRDVDALEQRTPSEEYSDVWAVEFVGGAGEKVTLPDGDVDGPVSGVVDSIHERQRPDRMGEPYDSGHVVDSAKHVRCSTDGNEARAGAEALGEMVEIELAGRWIKACGPHGDSAVADQGTPGGDVGVVIQLRDNDFIPRTPGATERTGEVEGKRCHVESERDLIGRSTEEIGIRRPSMRDELIGLVTRGIRPVRVGVVVAEIVHHGVDNGRGNLGSARPVEVRDRPTAVTARECRKLSANLTQSASGESGDEKGGNGKLDDGGLERAANCYSALTRLKDLPEQALGPPPEWPGGPPVTQPPPRRRCRRPVQRPRGRHP